MLHLREGLIVQLSLQYIPIELEAHKKRGVGGMVILNNFWLGFPAFSISTDRFFKEGFKNSL